MTKETVAHPHNGILLNNKNKCTTDPLNKTGKKFSNASSKKLSLKGYLLFDSLIWHSGVCKTLGTENSSVGYQG